MPPHAETQREDLPEEAAGSLGCIRDTLARLWQETERWGRCHFETLWRLAIDAVQLRATLTCRWHGASRVAAGSVAMVPLMRHAGPAASLPAPCGVLARSDPAEVTVVVQDWCVAMASGGLSPEQVCALDRRCAWLRQREHGVLQVVASTRATPVLRARARVAQYVVRSSLWDTRYWDKCSPVTGKGAEPLHSLRPNNLIARLSSSPGHAVAGVG